MDAIDGPGWSYRGGCVVGRVLLIVYPYMYVLSDDRSVFSAFIQDDYYDKPIAGYLLRLYIVSELPRLPTTPPGMGHNLLSWDPHCEKGDSSLRW